MREDSLILRGDPERRVVDATDHLTSLVEHRRRDDVALAIDLGQTGRAPSNHAKIGYTLDLLERVGEIAEIVVQSKAKERILDEA